MRRSIDQGHWRYSNSLSDLSPISIRRRSASEKFGLSCCDAAHLVTAARVSLDTRTPTIDRTPVRGRPRLFRFRGVDLTMFFVNINSLAPQAGRLAVFRPFAIPTNVI